MSCHGARAASIPSQIAKIVKRAAARVVGAADRGLGQVTVAVPAGVVAFAVEVGVLGHRKCRSVEAMSGTERATQAEKKIFVAPIFGKEIVALVEADALQRESAHHPLEKILRQALGCLRPIR